MVKMTPEQLLNMSIKFYTAPKSVYPENKFLATPLTEARLKMQHGRIIELLRDNVMLCK